MVLALKHRNKAGKKVLYKKNYSELNNTNLYWSKAIEKNIKIVKPLIDDLTL